MTATPKMEWLWPGRIPLSGITLIVGDPGVGKSFLTLDLAARVSSGSPMPGAAAPALGPSSVVLLSADDSPSQTIRPHIDDAGGDPKKVILVEGVRDLDGYKTPLNILTQLPRLEKLVASMGDCRLVIIDPLTAYITKNEEYQYTKVRTTINSLRGFAGRCNVAVVIVSNLTRALLRILGSIWLVKADRRDPLKLWFCTPKSNIWWRQKSLAFRIDPQTRRLVWESETAEDQESGDEG